MGAEIEKRSNKIVLFIKTKTCDKLEISMKKIKNQDHYFRASGVNTELYQRGQCSTASRKVMHSILEGITSKQPRRAKGV